MLNSIDMCHPLCLPYECCDVETRPDDFPEEPVKHYFLELLLLWEGRIEIALEREKVTVSPGEAVVICPGVRHHIDPQGEIARMHVIRLDPDRLPGQPSYAPHLKAILREAWKRRLPMVIPADEAGQHFLPQMFAQCVREKEARSFGYDVGVGSILTLVSLAVVRFWMSRGLKIENCDPREDPIYSLPAYIQLHLQDNLRVEDLAARCDLSYPWFARKFREIYGVSCKDYIEQIRVARVEHYLLFTDLDLARISDETGYADCSHMIKNFKRLMNITPGQYRLKRRQELSAG